MASTANGIRIIEYDEPSTIRSLARSVHFSGKSVTALVPSRPTAMPR